MQLTEHKAQSRLIHIHERFESNFIANALSGYFKLSSSFGIPFVPDDVFAPIGDAEELVFEYYDTCHNILLDCWALDLFNKPADELNDNELEELDDESCTCHHYFSQELINSIQESLELHRIFYVSADACRGLPGSMKLYGDVTIVNPPTKEVW